MSQNRLWILIARQISGEASPEEVEEMQILLEVHPDKQHLLEILQAYFSAHPEETAPEISDEDVEERFRQILTRSSDPPTRIRTLPFRKILRYAAVITGLGAAGLLGYRQLSRGRALSFDVAVHANEVVSRQGTRTRLSLPDGTQVWLNAGSRLDYKDNFNAGLREVELEGEAFFDVTKDARHPFIVHTSGINVRVLGTAFNLKSYPQESTIEATLLRGLIEVSRKDNPDAPKVILKPNEKLTFNKQYSSLSIHPGGSGPVAGNQTTNLPGIAVTSIAKNLPDSEKIETSWIYNRLVFNGDSFKELTEKMERWYNVKFVFQNDDLLKYRFKGVFTNETVEEALSALKLTAKFEYKIFDNEIELFDK